MDYRTCMITIGMWIMMLFIPIGLVPEHALSQTTEKTASEFPEAIEDNSFFVEEAYNQEDRVVQHISNAFVSFAPAKQQMYSFTQEWPAWGRKHQLSFTLPYTVVASGDRGHFGDLLLNYRLQLLDDDAWCDVAPRLSVIVPTGSVPHGTGNGVVGAQINLPFSKRLSDGFVAHLNAGATLLPQAQLQFDDGREEKHTLSGYNLGGSIIWLAHPNINLMLEYVTTLSTVVNDDGSTDNQSQAVLNPGLRVAINLDALQIVPGVGIPITFEGGESHTGAFLYLSFEHPY
jgi:hypothetical protein